MHVLEECIFPPTLQFKILKHFQAWPDALFSQLNDDILFRLSHYSLFQICTHEPESRHVAPWRGSKILAQNAAYYQSLFRPVKEYPRDL
jgi:hypothetical protein